MQRAVAPTPDAHFKLLSKTVAIAEKETLCLLVFTADISYRRPEGTSRNSPWRWWFQRNLTQYASYQPLNPDYPEWFCWSETDSCTTQKHKPEKKLIKTFVIMCEMTTNQNSVSLRITAVVGFLFSVQTKCGSKWLIFEQTPNNSHFPPIQRRL